MKTAVEIHTEDILKNGPQRVVVDAEGYACNPKFARQEHGVKPDIIFIRRDGWSLGAPEAFERIAYSLWISEWVAFFRRGETTAHPIKEYYA